MFAKEDIVKELHGHVASAVIFSANGVRVFVDTTVGLGRVAYTVEKLGKDEWEAFDTLNEAMEYAEANQR